MHDDISFNAHLKNMVCEFCLPAVLSCLKQCFRIQYHHIKIFICIKFAQHEKILFDIIDLFLVRPLLDSQESFVGL